jgi:hypothetical protein
MATKTINADKPGQETVLSGDTLIIQAPTRRNSNEHYRPITLGITPIGAASADVYSSATPWGIIHKDPDAAPPAVNWKPWLVGTVTSANSDTASDTFTGYVSAVKVKATGGSVVVEYGV